MLIYTHKEMFVTSCPSGKCLTIIHLKIVYSKNPLISLRWQEYRSSTKLIAPSGRIQMRYSVIALLVVILFSGCHSVPENPAEQPPAWIENPGDGAVGSSTTHVKGRHYQEELAIARARERLAARYGVTISSVSNIEEKVRNDTLFVRSDHEIRQVIPGTEVKAAVRAIWHDKTSDTLWVLIYPVP